MKTFGQKFKEKKKEFELAKYGKKLEGKKTKYTK